MSATVELRGVSKRFNSVLAVDKVTLRVESGEFLTLLGPSGCGKTTLLRMVAGFETPDAGTVTIGGMDVTLTPPNHRDVNQVFQSYALFPHLTVRDNIAFGLRMQRLPASDIAKRVAEAIALVSLAGCEDRRPHELSGGQRQRVALARALAPRPAVLLLDEPLSALDARLRQSMQLELKRLQREVGTTFILVTHDQAEALTMSDRIALINRGRVEQIGTPEDIYRRPATAFTAEFVGEANLLEAELLAATSEGDRVRLKRGLELVIASGTWPAGAKRAIISIRPEKLALARTRPAAQENVFEARVDEALFMGASDEFAVTTTSGVRLMALLASGAAGRESVRKGDQVWCTIHGGDIVVVGTGSDRAEML